MFLRIQQFFRKQLPYCKATIFKLLYSSKQLQIGKNFSCDTFPDIQIDKNCTLIIGDNVQFRRNVELRIHGASRIKIADSCRIDRGVRILAANSAEIILNKGVRIGLYSVLNGGDSIKVGEKSLLSGFVYLQTSMHKYAKNSQVQDQGYTHAPVLIGNDVWIGTHAVILPGCHIGDGSVVGSNAVVTKSVEPNFVVGGVPAQILKERM